MLQQLQIHNYAIIDQLDISFNKGLNVITGETGAGKSIIMGALSLILGERADSNVLLDKEKKCFVEGLFKTESKAIKQFLKDNDIDDNAEIVIRREISSSGKSRAFINDSPAPLSLLKQLSSLLVDLHQQFDTLELGDSDFQREVIDALAGNAPLLQQYQSLYRLYIASKKVLEDLRQQQAAANKELDYHKFLFNELEEADLQEDELEHAEAALKLSDNAENIKATLGRVYEGLQEGEHPLVQQLKTLNNQLQGINSFHESIQLLSERLHSAQVELQDIADEVERLNNTVSHDPQRVSLLNERLDTGYKLLKKHGVTTTAHLLQIKEELQGKLDKITNLGDEISQREKEVMELLEKASELSKSLSLKRQKEIKPFEDKVNQLLTQVGMPNAKLKVGVTSSAELNISGADKIEFLFDANKSNRFQPLSKVASGGELSRLMLSIKSLVAKSIQLPTLIFDEIDTGISGEAARQVGVIMKELSKQHQLITITHQPQIAAKAAAHYFIYKEIKNDKILTAVKLLNGDERITTIATMLARGKAYSSGLRKCKRNDWKLI